MKNNNIKNLFIAGITLLSFGFLSAQFVIPSGINNAYQLIQRVWITTSGTTTGSTVVDLNTGSNKIYVNPNFLSPTSAYSGQYLLTLDTNGYLSFTSGSVGGGMSGAYISGGNLYLSFNNGATTNLGGVAGATGANGQNGVGIATIIDNNNGTFTVNLSNGSGYTLNIPGSGGAQYWTQNGNDLYPSTLTNNIGIGTNSPSEKLTVDGSFSSTNNNFIVSNTDTTFGGDAGVGMQGSTGDQYYWIGINDDGNGFFTNEMSYTNTITSTYANYGINPNFGVVMNRWDDFSTFPLGRSAVAVDSNGVKVIGKSIGNDTNMIRYNDNFDTLMHLQNDGLLGVNTANPIYPLTVSGGSLSIDQEVSFFAINDGSGIGIPIPVAGVQIDASASSGLSSQVLVYDTRGVNPSNPQVGFAFMNKGAIGAPLERESRISSNNGEEISIVVASGIDVINETAITQSEIEVAHNHVKIYGSGGFAEMHFNGVIGLFGFGTNVPGNTIDIGRSYIGGTAGLRFSHRGLPGLSGQILGINGLGDVVMLGNISGFGGGGAQYWTQNGNNIYPSILNNNVGIGLSNPVTTLGISGTVLMQQGNRGWEFANDDFAPGIDRIGASFISGSESVHQSVVDVFNGVPISNIGWFDTNTNEESNFTAFRQSATMHYNANRANINAGLWNGIDVTPNDVEIKYDKNNASGDYTQINLGPFGIRFDIGTTTHVFNDSGFVGINNNNPSETLSVSGTFVVNDGSQGFASNPNLLGVGIPGAMASVSSGNTLGFLMAGIPGSNPIFNAGIGAYLGYVDMNSPNNERTIFSARSGSMTMDIMQGGNYEVSIDITPSIYSIASNNGLNTNMFIDFSNNHVGINKNNPQKALDVSGAIVSEQLWAFNGFESGPFDVQSVNSIAIDTSVATGVVNCLFNGTRGQVVHIFKTSINNAVTIQHESNTCAQTNHQIRLLSQVDRNFGVGMYGGVTLVYDGNYWYVMATESSFVP